MMEDVFKNTIDLLEYDRNRRLVRARQQNLSQRTARNPHIRSSPAESASSKANQNQSDNSMGVVKSPSKYAPGLPLQMRVLGARFCDDLPQHVGSTVTRLLKFERDFVLPAMALMEIRNVSKQTNFLRMWYTEMASYADDPLTAYTYLARIAADIYAATSNEQHLQISQYFRLKGIVLLRESLAPGTEIDKMRLRRALLILLFADSVLHDQNAMLAHTKMLVRASIALDESPSTLENAAPYNLQHLVSIAYHDAQDSARTFRQTILDLGHGGWLEQRFSEHWKEILPLISESPAAVALMTDTPMLDGDLMSPYLRLLLIDVRDLDRAKAVFQSESFDRSSWLYLISKLVFALGRFVNHLVGLYETMEDRSDSDTEPRRAAVVCLCVILLLRRSAHIEIHPWDPVSGVRRQSQAANRTADPGRNMVQMLKQFVSLLAPPEPNERAEEPLEPLETNDLPKLERNKANKRMLIWALWTGALIQREFDGDSWPYEWSLATRHAHTVRSLADVYGSRSTKAAPPTTESDSSALDSEERWFSSRLAIALREGPEVYARWNDVEKVLGGFYHPRSLRPGFDGQRRYALWFTFNVSLLCG
jgi:hypothetical protein